LCGELADFRYAAVRKKESERPCYYSVGGFPVPECGLWLAGLLAASGVVLAIACGSAITDREACAPGRSIACVSQSGCSGAQTCKADGSGFEACQCGAAPDVDADTDLTADSGNHARGDSGMTGRDLAGSEEATATDVGSDSSKGQDTGITDVGSPPEDTNSPVDTGSPPEDAGGCSVGSVIFMATDPGSVFTADTYGDFNTTGAVCVKLLGGITNSGGGWVASNVAGRTLTLNGASVANTEGAQGVVAPGPDGYAIWEWSAGSVSYAGMDFY
jgi:hypothetical protein